MRSRSLKSTETTRNSVERLIIIIKNNLKEFTDEQLDRIANMCIFEGIDREETKESPESKL